MKKQRHGITEPISLTHAMKLSERMEKYSRFTVLGIDEVLHDVLLEWTRMVAQLEAENERLRGLLAKANHYTSCYNLHFPDSGANWVEEEVNKVLERGECWIAERD